MAADGNPLAVLVGLIALFGYFSVLVHVRSPFLRDEPFDQSKKTVVKIRIFDRFPPHDSKNLCRTRRHRDRSRPNSCARRLFHFLELADLPFRRNENDARTVAVVGTGGLQAHSDINLLLGLGIPCAGQYTGLAGPLQHVPLTEKCALDAPTDSIATTGNRFTERSRPHKGSARIAFRCAACGHRRNGEQDEARYRYRTPIFAHNKLRLRSNALLDTPSADRSSRQKIHEESPTDQSVMNNCRSMTTGR